LREITVQVITTQLMYFYRHCSNSHWNFIHQVYELEEQR